MPAMAARKGSEAIKDELREEIGRIAADAQAECRDLRSEVQALKAALRESLDAQGAACRRQVEELAGSMDKRLAVAERQIAELSEQARRPPASDCKLEGELRQLHGSVKEQSEAERAARAKQEEQLRQEVERRLGRLRQQLDSQLEAAQRQASAAQRQELEAAAAAQRQQLEAAAAAQRQQLEAAVEELRSRTATLCQQASDRAASSLERAEQIRQQRQEATERRLEELSNSMQSCREECLESRRADSEQCSSLHEELSSTRSEAEKQLAAVQAENCRRLNRLEDGAAQLELSCAAVLGVPVRKVEWRIESCKDAIVRGVRSGTPEQSWFSPVFQAAGCSALQLELRLARQTSESGHSIMEGSAYLWAAAGLQLSFRLTIGHEVSSSSHAFDGQSACPATRVENIVEQISKRDGALRLSLEIDDATNDSSKGGAGKPSAEPRAPVIARHPIKGSISVQQRVNHRLEEVVESQGSSLVELVQRKVDAVRSRAVRHVQWRLEQGGQLRRFFAQGQPICSTAFQAAGISGMQLVFYPSGSPGAREGFCSLFLSCPTGCTLRCWLSAGKFRREARPEAADKPALLGRVNFCRFDLCVDSLSDAIDLSLEIETVQQQQSTTETATTPASQLLESGGSLEASPTSGVTSPRMALERRDVSMIKGKMQPAKASPGKAPMEQVTQLPAIWTMSGFMTFDELRESQEAGARQGGGGSGALSGGPSLMFTSVETNDSSRLFRLPDATPRKGMITSSTPRGQHFPESDAVDELAKSLSNRKALHGADLNKHKDMYALYTPRSAA